MAPVKRPADGRNRVSGYEAEDDGRTRVGGLEEFDYRGGKRSGGGRRKADRTNKSKEMAGAIYSSVVEREDKKKRDEEAAREKTRKSEATRPEETPIAPGESLSTAPLPPPPPKKESARGEVAKREEMIAKAEEVRLQQKEAQAKKAEEIANLEKKSASIDERIKKEVKEKIKKSKQYSKNAIKNVENVFDALIFKAEDLESAVSMGTKSGKNIAPGMSSKELKERKRIAVQEEEAAQEKRHKRVESKASKEEKVAQSEKAQVQEKLGGLKNLSIAEKAFDLFADQVVKAGDRAKKGLGKLKAQADIDEIDKGLAEERRAESSKKNIAKEAAVKKIREDAGPVETFTKQKALSLSESVEKKRQAGDITSEDALNQLAEIDSMKAKDKDEEEKRQHANRKQERAQRVEAGKEREVARSQLRKEAGGGTGDVTGVEEPTEAALTARIEKNRQKKKEETESEKVYGQAQQERDALEAQRAKAESQTPVPLIATKEPGKPGAPTTVPTPSATTVANVPGSEVLGAKILKSDKIIEAEAAAATETAQGGKQKEDTSDAEKKREEERKKEEEERKNQQITLTGIYEKLEQIRIVLDTTKEVSEKTEKNTKETAASVA